MRARETRKIPWWVLGVSVAAAATVAAAAIGACNPHPVTEAEGGKEQNMAFKLTSPAFKDNERIPKKYTS